MDPDLLNIETYNAMHDPQEGDLFEEFYTHWVYIVKVTSRYIYTLSASAPCEFPKDGQLHKRTKEQFLNYYSYQSQNQKDKFWIKLWSRGNNVKGWFLSTLCNI
jgi:hypothetical protein